MGVIGKNLIKRIEEAEAINDWSLLLQLLGEAQKKAVRNYTEMMSNLIVESNDKDA